MYSFKAAILRAKNVVTTETIHCEKLPAHSVFVQVSMAGVCRSQLMEFRGGRGYDKWLPHLFGHEAVGKVIETGSQVSKVSVGDEVILTWLSPQSENFEPPELLDDYGQQVNSGRIATFGEFAVVHEDCCILKPMIIKDDVAVLFGCALGTGAGMALDAMKEHTAKDHICVLGLGGIGTSALLSLLAQNCKNVIAFDQNPKKVEWARTNFGIQAETSSKDVFASFSDQFDLCLEATGSVVGIEAGFSIIKRNGGELIFASHPPDDEYIRLKPHDLISGKKIRGTWGGGINPRVDFPKLASLFEGSQELLAKSVGPYFDLHNVEDALINLELGEVFRPIITMTNK